MSRQKRNEIESLSYTACKKKKKKFHVDLRLKECKTITLLENIKIFKIRYKNVQTQKKRFINLFA